MRSVLIGARLFTGDRMIDGGALVIDGDRIAAVITPEARADTGASTGASTGAQLAPDVAAKLAAAAPGDAIVHRLPADAVLAPGFVDAQINGAGGLLFNDTPTAAAAIAIAARVRRTGTTGVLPTLMTDDAGALARACDAAIDAVARPGCGVLGLHLEGPFLSPERPGVHRPQWMRPPEPADIDRLVATAERLAGRGRMIVTLAPERVDDRDIARLAAAGVIVAAGHTAASVERTRAALAAGVRGFTHLFNAMPPIASRAPGPVTAALADRDAWCTVIADGLHVHPALLRLLVDVKPRGKVVLVTDAMPPSGTDQPSFQLFGRTIRRVSGRLVTDDGTLAGTDIDMAAAVRNCIDLLGLPLDEALRMASLYPAAYLGLDHQVGRIAPGYRADLALLRPDLSVLATWVGGDEQWYGDAAAQPAASRAG